VEAGGSVLQLIAVEHEEEEAAEGQDQPGQQYQAARHSLKVIK
jgi:hypothetical protein